MKPNRMNPEYQRDVANFVQREVIYCASQLVYELVAVWESMPREYHDDLLGAYQTEPDYEEAARDHGWDEKDDNIVKGDEFVDSWEDACDEDNIDAYDYRREVYEHWIVSNWLANKLEEHGEKILRDFFGIDAIWCRTTTGQAISMDSVICDVWDSLPR